LSHIIVNNAFTIFCDMIRLRVLILKVVLAMVY